jgi:hypothetical protein
MKSRVLVIALFAISMTVLIAGRSNGLVFAQVTTPCTASLNAPGVPAQYSNSNAPFVVPVFASCTGYYGTQLYATGNAYDVTSNTAMGSASGLLSPVNGGTQFSGQLAFNTPPTSPSDSVQVSVSVYDNQGGNLLATTGTTIQPITGPAQPVQPLQPVQQVVTTTVTADPYANPYPTVYPSPGQSSYYPYPSQYAQQYPSRPATYYYSPRWYNANLFAWVAIITIIAAVIIGTAGLVLIARKRPTPQGYWYPVPPPPR